MTFNGAPVETLPDRLHPLAFGRPGPETAGCGGGVAAVPPPILSA